MAMPTAHTHTHTHTPEAAKQPCINCRRRQENAPRTGSCKTDVSAMCCSFACNAQDHEAPQSIVDPHTSSKGATARVAVRPRRLRGLCSFIAGSGTPGLPAPARKRRLRMVHSAERPLRKDYIIFDYVLSHYTDLLCYTILIMCHNINKPLYQLCYDHITMLWVSRHHPSLPFPFCCPMDRPQNFK